MPCSPPGRQGGWVGLVVILIALAIVAWLSKDALMKYGGSTTTSTRRAGQAVAPVDLTAEPPTPGNVMDKAKSLEGMLQQESTKRDGGN